MLSGIGPAEHLQKLGINVLQNSRVGDNLQDHVGMTGLTFLIDKPVSIVQNRFQVYVFLMFIYRAITKKKKKKKKKCKHHIFRLRKRWKKKETGCNWLVAQVVTGWSLVSKWLCERGHVNTVGKERVEERWKYIHTRMWVGDYSGKYLIFGFLTNIQHLATVHILYFVLKTGWE